MDEDNSGAADKIGEAETMLENIMGAASQMK